MRKGLLIIAVIFLMALLTLAWLLATSSGLRALVSVAERIEPALSIEQVEGRLIGPLTVNNLNYIDELNSQFAIQKLELDWALSALLTARLPINKLHITGVTLGLNKSDPEAEETEIVLPEISLPIAIELADFQLNDVQLLSPEGQKTSLIDSFTTTLSVERNQLIIQSIHLERPDVEASLSGDITMLEAYPLNLDYEVTLKQVIAEPLQLTGNLSGDLNTLVLHQKIGEPFVSSQQLKLIDVLKELRWSLVTQADVVDLAALNPEQTTRLEALQLSASGSLTELKAQLTTNVQQLGLPVLAVKANVDSADLENWQINSTVQHAEALLALVGVVSTTEAEPTVDAQLNWQNLSWPLENATPEFASPEGQLELKGSLSDYQATLTAALKWSEQAVFVETTSSGDATSLNVEALTVNGFDGVLKAVGSINWATETLQYQLNANWQDIVLPASLVGKAIALQQGQIELDGNPEQLSLSTKTQLMIDEVNASLEANGQGETSTGFEQAELMIGLEDGTVSYIGPLRWLGDKLVDGRLTITELNLGALMEDWPGKLSGQSAISVKNTDAGIHVSAEDIQIRGDLRQRPLSLTGAVSYRNALIDVSQLELQSGQSKLAANGQLQDDKLAFTWTVNSPDLQDFYPDIAGSILARGDLAGNMKQPAVNAVIQAESLVYQEFKVAKLATEAKLELDDNARVSATVQLEQIETPQLVADSLQLTVAGSQQEHDIVLTLNSAPIQLAVEADGSLNSDYQWKGRLQKFDFENAKAGSWTLTEKGEITLSESQQAVPRHCWTSNNGLICLEAKQDKGSWQTSGEFAHLPLSLFEGFAVELEQLTGMLRGQFDLASGIDSVIRGTGDVYLDDASLQLNQSALNQKKPLQLNNVSLSYLLDEKQTSAKFHLEPVLDGVSAIDANIETAAAHTLVTNPEQAGLDGKITTAVKDLSALELSHPAFDDIQGQLDINLSLSGTLAQPKIEGLASLQQGQIAIVDAGIILKQIQAKVKGNLDQVDFDLQARSGDGVMTGEGEFRLTEHSWELATALKGRQLEVMNTPEALVIAEPDLTINITPKLTLVKGKVHIPEAELEPTAFNSAVSPSRDVVVVTDEAETTSGAVTKVDVTVSLGDKVKLQAMGFQGRLTGDLRVFGKTSDILLANGEIKIKDGSYLAYGQLLHVDDGSIRFAGGAIDNPELDIKAVRKGKDYQAGLHIQGFASAPQANLFSTPDMGQDDVLSYILLGKPLAQASATDAAILASAATGMGLQNGAMLGDQIASTFGLDEFTIGGDSAENAALQVGKYLSPKLYLSYGIGVFESVSTVELRYELSKIWALKAESGTESGVDLLYTYERGKPEDRQ